MNDLERLRRDWQQRESPTVDVAGLQRRLSRNWVLALFEALVLLGVAALLTLTALDTRGWMGWIYWSFFALFFVVLTFYGVRLRMQAFRRRDDTTSAILDHAWRDAVVREAGGVMALWSAPVVWSFVIIWLIVDGWSNGMSLRTFIQEYWFPFAFVTVWCLLGAVTGAFMRERGRRRKGELQRLADELSDRSETDL
jgi:hypothetical protein